MKYKQLLNYTKIRLLSLFNFIKFVPKLGLDGGRYLKN